MPAQEATTQRTGRHVTSHRIAPPRHTARDTAATACARWVKTRERATRERVGRTKTRSERHTGRHCVSGTYQLALQLFRRNQEEGHSPQPTAHVQAVALKQAAAAGRRESARQPTSTRTRLADAPGQRHQNRPLQDHPSGEGAAGGVGLARLRLRRLHRRLYRLVLR
eukprot:COSAG06_NODE_3270_length_5587_cov_1.993988_5_plen_167_part_00